MLSLLDVRSGLTRIMETHNMIQSIECHGTYSLLELISEGICLRSVILG